MPDITLCMESNCKRKRLCYRYMAKPDRWQSYSFFYNKNKKCRYFMIALKKK